MSKHLSPSKHKTISVQALRETASAALSKLRAVNDRPEEKQEELGFSIRDLALSLGGAALLAALWFLPTEGKLRFCLFFLPAAVAGFEVIRQLILKLLDRRFLTRESLCVLSAVVAFCLGEGFTGALLIVLYSLLRLVEAYLSERVRRDEELICSVLPDKACVLDGVDVESVDADIVVPGTVLVVEPGEVVPLDGIVVEGVTAFDTSPITGEKTPFNGAAGCPVAGGYINRTSPIKVEVTRSRQDCLAAQMARNVLTRAGFRSRLENFTLRFSRFYTPAACIAALLLAVLPPIFGGGWVDYLSRAGAILAVASPAGIALCVRCMYSAGMRSALRSGILIEGTPFLEQLSRVDSIVMCKTGIVTEGRYTVTGVFPENKLTDKELLATAAEAERGSKHGIARALRAAAGISEDSEETIRIEELPGKGVSAFVQSHNVYVGTAALLEEHGIRFTLPNRTGAAIHVALDNVYLGHITISDKVRGGAFDALEAVRHLGVTTLVLLTGDVQSATRTTASRLNFDMMRTELSPEGKVSAVEYLVGNTGKNSALAFVGDADTDSAVMAAADLGIAFDAARSENAAELADVCIMSDNIRRLPCALKIARMTVYGAQISVGVMLGAKALALLLSALGLLPIAAAACIETAAGAFAALNALRARGFDKKSERLYIK